MAMPPKLDHVGMALVLAGLILKQGSYHPLSITFALRFGHHCRDGEDVVEAHANALLLDSVHGSVGLGDRSSP